jgi:hypothetical protein
MGVACSYVVGQTLAKRGCMKQGYIISQVQAGALLMQSSVVQTHQVGVFKVAVRVRAVREHQARAHVQTARV